jgi:hypothetical protein
MCHPRVKVRSAALQINRPRRIILTLVVALIGTAGGALYLWLWAPLATLDQRMAAGTAVLTAGALAIAVFAGYVAWLAYRDASRKPRLLLLVVADPVEFPAVHASLSNQGDVSARFAVVWLRFEGDVELMSTGGGWITEAPKVLRWEASAGTVIHPTAPPYTLPAYTLPPVNLRVRARHCEIFYTVAADGFPPVTDVVEVGPQPGG